MKHETNTVTFLIFLKWKECRNYPVEITSFGFSDNSTEALKLVSSADCISTSLLRFSASGVWITSFDCSLLLTATDSKNRAGTAQDKALAHDSPFDTFRSISKTEKDDYTIKIKFGIT